jgi:elongation factor Ts
MSNIELLKQLREISFAPLKDCKEALAEANDDLTLAQDILRKKGISKAGNRAGRETKEGIVRAETRDGKIVGLKLACETDFVAKNENFQELFNAIFDKIAEQTNEIATIEDIDPIVYEKINADVQEFMGKTGENMQIGEVLVTSKRGYVYNHPGNRVATIVYYEGEQEEVAKELALQITAMNPMYVSFDQADQNEIAKMTEEFTAELKAAGKPEAMIAQIVEGKVKKTLADSVLLEQEYIRDGSKKVKEILPEGFTVLGFRRIAIGG